jgi:phosphoglycerate dehydrogenase-like enzyme
MALALLVDPDWTAAAAQAIALRRPDLEIVTDRARMEGAHIRCIVTFNPPAGTFARLPGLRLICSPGAGAEKLLESADLPAGVPLVRVADPAANVGIAQYVVYMLLRQLRAFAGYEAQQREQVWKRIPVPLATETTVGVLGLGGLGVEVARAAASLGFRVSGWSRSQHELPGVRCHSGEEGLQACLSESNFLVCVLPLTSQTHGLLNRQRLALLPRGAYVINVARGAHVVAADLLALVDAGHLAGAALDVHVPEPLPAGHPLWGHPAITVTPHIAWRTTAQALAEQLCTNLDRLDKGQPLLNEVLRERGY